MAASYIFYPPWIDHDSLEDPLRQDFFFLSHRYLFIYKILTEVKKIILAVVVIVAMLRSAVIVLKISKLKKVLIIIIISG